MAGMSWSAPVLVRFLIFTTVGVFCQSCVNQINATDLEDVLREGPGNTSIHDGLQYAYFNKVRITQENAKKLCALWNGTLANIKDNATQVHIQNSMPSFNCRSFYIVGLTHVEDDDHVNGTDCARSFNVSLPPSSYPRWKWGDGTLINESSFTNWKRKNLTFSRQEPNGCKLKPNGSRLQHSPHTQILGDSTSPYFGQWHDKHIGSKWFVICQRKAPPLHVAEPPQTTSSTAPTTTATTATTTTTTTTTTTVATTTEPTPPQVEPPVNASSVVQDILRNFSIQNWESNGTKLLAEAILAQKDADSLDFDFPEMGVAIKLQKINASSVRQAPVNVDVSGDAVAIDTADLDTDGTEMALVSASFSEKAYRSSGLTSAHPAVEQNKQKVQNPHSEISLLPENLKVLSVTLFTSPNNTGTAVKVSVPANMTFNLSRDTTLANIFLKQKRTVVASSQRCVYLDPVTQSWSGVGCGLVEASKGVVHCSCNHTTSFGVIFAVTSIKVPSEVDLFVVVLEVLSVLFLALTVSLLLWLRKRLHRDRTWIQINLSGSLLLLHFFFLMGSVAAKEKNPQLCEAFAVLSHYFTLTTALWMFNEGFVLHLKTGERALKFSVDRVLPRLLVFAWGAPFLYVCVCATIGLLRGVYLDVKIGYTPDGSLPKYDRCWLGYQQGMIYSVIAPLLLIFIATILLLVKISLAINKMSEDALKLRPSVMNNGGTGGGMTPAASVASIPMQKEKILRQVRVTFKAAVTLLPVLGVPWLLGFLVNIPGAEIPFLILHGVVNGLQGLFIFIIYCARSKQFRLVFRRKWKQMPSTSQSFSLNRFSSGLPS